MTMNLKTALQSILVEAKDAKLEMADNASYHAQAKVALLKARTEHAEELTALRARHAEVLAELAEDVTAEQLAAKATKTSYRRRWVRRMKSALKEDLKNLGATILLFTVRWPAALIGIAIVFIGSLFFLAADGKEGFTGFWKRVTS